MAAAWRELGGRVLYLELGGPDAPYRERAKSAGTEPVEAEPGIFVLRLWKLAGMPWSYPNFLRRLNLARQLRRVGVALKRINFQPGQFIALYYGWFWQEWLDRLPARLHVYDCIDEHREYPVVEKRPRMQAYVWKHEQQQLKATDLLVVTSPLLLRDREALAAKNVILPNGVDWAAWSACVDAPPEEPADMAKLPHPRAVLTGNLQRKLDFTALDKLAQARPEIQIVLIGPLEPGTALPPNRPNLHWLGAKPYRELEAYYAHADVGLLPLRRTPYNAASCPLKLLEYLAVGLPVAASRTFVTEYWSTRAGCAVCLYDAPEAFGTALDAALEAGRKTSRHQIRQSVRDATWTARALALWKTCGEISNRQAKPKGPAED